MRHRLRRRYGHVRQSYGRGHSLNVAYHEAGHAVVAEHLGLHVGQLVKTPKRELSLTASKKLVAARKTGEASPDIAAEAEKHLICALAGRLAEEIASGKHIPAGWHPFDTKDAHRFKALIGTRTLQPYVAEAKHILDANWPEVEKIARMYLSRTRVSGKAIREEIGLE